jgi:hypothetical protein
MRTPGGCDCRKQRLYEVKGYYASFCIAASTFVGKLSSGGSTVTFLIHGVNIERHDGIEVFLQVYNEEVYKFRWPGRRGD